MFLHAFEQRRLRLGRRAIDFIGEQDVRKDRPGLEAQMLAAGGVVHQHLGADDVRGHEVGRELDAREAQIERVGQRLDEQCLAQSGCALEQHMPAREHGREHAVDDVGVADDDLFHLRSQCSPGPDKLFHAILTHETPSGTH